ncbi:MAG TPA: ABC transporter permease [Edaphocola sp.]|nr:ABC transporter permease [Edaphocola sp.]
MKDKIPQKYSQFSALKALTKASIRSMMKSPSAVVFSIAFPLIFIFAFGFIGDLSPKVKLSISSHSDLANPVFTGIMANKSFQVMTDLDSITERQEMQKSRIQAIVDIQKAENGTFKVKIITGSHNLATAEQVEASINEMFLKTDKSLNQTLSQLVTVNKQIVKDREYKLIDFILPGQLGFSLLAASIFGTAFVFFGFRQMLVLKRFFATPIKRSVILLSEGLARLIFQLTGALLIILIGKYFLDFTLINGWITVLNMMLVSALALLVFMSFGFIISGLAKSESVIPPLSNIITLPQFLLAGTFFPIDTLPTYLQYLAKIMPLTYFNNALRAIAFDGANLWEVRFDIFIIILWGIVGYAIATRLFKWE